MGDEVGGGELVELLVLPNQLEAEMLATQLVHQGVRAVVVSNSGTGRWAPQLGLLDGARIEVLDEDLDLACELLEEIDNLDLDEAGSP